MNHNAALNELECTISGYTEPLTDAEIDRIMSDPGLKDFFIHAAKLDRIEVHALTLFMLAFSDGIPAVDAAKIAAIYLTEIGGYESFADHIKTVAQSLTEK